jgi:transcriptional regulator with XRE-family HTH domain
MTTVETILEKVRTLRRSSGYSQTEMADVFGVEQSNYGKKERGETKLSVDDILRISSHFKISPMFFFEDMIHPREVDPMGPPQPKKKKSEINLLITIDNENDVTIPGDIQTKIVSLLNL